MNTTGLQPIVFILDLESGPVSAVTGGDKVGRMTTTEDLSVTVHYAPGDRPLCGSESWAAISTDELQELTSAN